MATDNMCTIFRKKEEFATQSVALPVNLDTYNCLNKRGKMGAVLGAVSKCDIVLAVLSRT
jgi:hypothetical protein